MTKEASNKDICSIKSALLLCEHGHFSLNLASNSPILIGLTKDLFFKNLSFLIDIIIDYEELKLFCSKIFN